MARKKKRAKVATRGARDFYHRAWTVPEMIRELRRYVTLPALARETTISAKTLRDYQSGKREPTPEHHFMLTQGFEILRKEMVREKAERKVKAIGAPVRVLWIDNDDPKKKRRIPGDSVDRYVAESDDSSILRVLKHAARRARLLDIPGSTTFLVLADELDPEYPGVYFWTRLEPINELNDDQIEDFYFREIRRRGTPIILRYQDRE